MKKKIYIITGSSKSGKTTKLMNWINSEKNIDGILEPVINGKRCFYHISSKTIFQLESNNEVNTVKVGKYRFNIYAFKWANEKLIESLNKNFDWIVVDEIGLLELKGEGLDKSIKILLSNNIKAINYVFVIRESLLNNVLEFYGIKEFEYMKI